MNWSIPADVFAFFGYVCTCKLVICNISGRVFSFLKYSCTWIGQFRLMFSHFLGMHTHASWWFAAFLAEFFHFLDMHLHVSWLFSVLYNISGQDVNWLSMLHLPCAWLQPTMIRYPLLISTHWHHLPRNNCKCASKHISTLLLPCQGQALAKHQQIIT